MFSSLVILSLYFVFTRFGYGLKEREEQLRVDEAAAQKAAADLQKEPYDDLSVEELKALIKARTNKRPRFTGVDLMETRSGSRGRGGRGGGGGPEQRCREQRG